ncbi:Receptor-like protein kinase HSL1 [Hordeum vulgare]|nr:Receptor-like protein kinase HSL1 [Hordeum vulgare]
MRNRPRGGSEKEGCRDRVRHRARCIGGRTAEGQCSREGGHRQQSAHPPPDEVVSSDELHSAPPRRVGEHRLVGCPAFVVPLPDVVDHAIVARFPSAKVPSPDPFVGVTESQRDHAVHAAPLDRSPIRQKEVRDEKKRQGKEEQMKQCMELQTKKLEMEEAAKKRKIDMKEAARQRQLDIEAANAATKAKEVALAIMSMDLRKMSEKTRSWFEARQKEMFDADGLN